MNLADDTVGRLCKRFPKFAGPSAVIEGKQWPLHFLAVELKKVLRFFLGFPRYALVLSTDEPLRFAGPYSGPTLRLASLRSETG